MATKLMPADTLARDAKAHRLFLQRVWPGGKETKAAVRAYVRRLDRANAALHRHLNRWLRRHSDDGLRPRGPLSVADIGGSGHAGELGHAGSLGARYGLAAVAPDLGGQGLAPRPHEGPGSPGGPLRGRQRN